MNVCRIKIQLRADGGDQCWMIAGKNPDAPTAAIMLVRPPDADVTRDGFIKGNDLLGVINAWGQGGGAFPANINGTDPVNVDDLPFVINHWGQCP